MISQEEAIEIAKKHHGLGFEFYGISHGLTDSCSVYHNSARSWAPDDVWCVLCSNHPREKGLIASSRAILIHKETGEILHDGFANDEG